MLHLERWSFMDGLLHLIVRSGLGRMATHEALLAVPNAATHLSRTVVPIVMLFDVAFRFCYCTVC